MCIRDSASAVDEEDESEEEDLPLNPADPANRLPSLRQVTSGLGMDDFAPVLMPLSKPEAADEHMTADPDEDAKVEDASGHHDAACRDGDDLSMPSNVTRL